MAERKPPPQVVMVPDRVVIIDATHTGPRPEVVSNTDRRLVTPRPAPPPPPPPPEKQK